MKNFLSVFALVSALLFASSPVLAWDGAVSGKILNIEVTHGGNYAVRVWLQDSPIMCGAGAKWAYLNEADSNYKVYVAAIMMAKAQGSTVTVYSNNVAGGFCQIGHLVVGN